MSACLSENVDYNILCMSRFFELLYVLKIRQMTFLWRSFQVTNTAAQKCGPAC